MAALRPPFEATSQMALALKIKEGKYSRLPKIYSEELWRVITLMLSPEKEKRPAVEDLLNFPQISLRLREKRLKESFEKLKRREQDLKNKDSKYDDLEAKFTELQELFNNQSKELERKNRELEEANTENTNLKKKLESKESISPPLEMSETPKLSYDRGSSFTSNSRLRGEGSSVYHSLKQEIRELSNQVSYDTSTHLKMKKQVSHIPAKREELLKEWKAENESKKTSLSYKSKMGNKSVERKKRKYDDISKSKKTYEYRKDSNNISTHDNKENVRWGNYVNSSAEGLSVKESYTTPPFRSYKSKIPEKEEKVHTTSYRSRSNVYNDSTRSSFNTRQLKSNDTFGDEGTHYATHKDQPKDRFQLRREMSNL